MQCRINNIFILPYLQKIWTHYGLFFINFFCFLFVVIAISGNSSMMQMLIPPKQKKHFSQTSTCLSLLKCLMSMGVYYSTILNTTPDLTNFQTKYTAKCGITILALCVILRSTERKLVHVWNCGLPQFFFNLTFWKIRFKTCIKIQINKAYINKHIHFRI